jgi:outer membrane lipoprotein-sorting protein
MPRCCPPRKTLGADLVRAAVAALVLSVGSSGSADDPSKILAKALDAQWAVPALLVQNRGQGEGQPPLRVKVQVVPGKGIQVTVLQPISWQGTVFFDDRRELKTYDPDNDRILVRPSPARFSASTAWRVERVRENYRIETDRGPTLAGRRTLVLTLEPKAAEMPVRRLTVDRANSVLLRYEIEMEDGKKAMYLDTLSAVYEADAASAGFGIDREEGTQIVRLPGPREFRTASAVRETVGFTPRVPDSLPDGFQAYARHILGEEGKEMVAIRLSDGMCAVTVYQWLGSRFKGRPPVRSRWAQRDPYGVMVAVEHTPGDLVPQAVIARILERFAGKKD